MMSNSLELSCQEDLERNLAFNFLGYLHCSLNQVNGGDSGGRHDNHFKGVRKGSNQVLCKGRDLHNSGGVGCHLARKCQIHHIVVTSKGLLQGNDSNSKQASTIPLEEKQVLHLLN